MKVTVFMIIVGIIFLCIFVGLLTLIVRALLKYIHSKDVRQEKSVVRKSLGEALKVHRTQCKMTQEFVAETIGVSRQAVSKWENGCAHPVMLKESSLIDCVRDSLKAYIGNIASLEALLTGIDQTSINQALAKEYSDHITDNERRLEQVLEFKARLYESLVGGYAYQGRIRFL